MEIVKGHELTGDLVMVGRQGLPQNRQMRIAIALLQIAQHLIIGAVFLDDEHHMFDLGADRRHARFRLGAGGGAGKADVAGHLQGGGGKGCGRRVGELQEPGFFELEDILVGRPARIAFAAIAGKRWRAALRVGAGRALAVDHEQPRPAKTCRNGARIPARRHQP